MEPTSPKKTSEIIDYNKIIPNEEMVCPITLVIMKNPTMLSCGHNFDEKAIQNWFDSNRKRLCPTCRTETSGTFPNLILKSLINNWKKETSYVEEVEAVEMVIEQKNPQPILQQLNNDSSNNSNNSNSLTALQQLQLPFPCRL